MNRVGGIGSLLVLAATSSFDARASKPEPVTLVVNSHMDLYQAGGNADGSDGTPPAAYSFPPAPGQVLAFSRVTGTWTCQSCTGGFTLTTSP